MKNLVTLLFLLSVMLVNSQSLFKKKEKHNYNDTTNKSFVVVNEFVVPYVKCINVCNKIEYITFNKDSVLLEMANLLDSIREYMYQRKLMVTKIDSNGNKGCKHHNKFLKNLYDPNNTDIGYVTHGEFKKEKNLVYRGNDTIFSNHTQRHYYFAKKNPLDYMVLMGEVCQVGSVKGIFNKGMTPRDMAREIIYSFYHSKPHWEILTSPYYTLLSGDIEFRKDSDGNHTYWLTITTGAREITTIVKHKSKFYYPGNTGGLTEYYNEEISKFITN